MRDDKTSTEEYSAGKQKKGLADILRSNKTMKPLDVLTVIQEGMTLSGNVSSMGDLHLDGRIKGDVHSHRLTVGLSAVVEGSVYGDEVTICGQVKGEIRARVVRLMSSADVVGDVLHDQLSIEAGAHLQGLCKRAESISFEADNILVQEAGRLALEKKQIDLDDQGL